MLSAYCHFQLFASLVLHVGAFMHARLRSVKSIPCVELNSRSTALLLAIPSRTFLVACAHDSQLV